MTSTHTQRLAFVVIWAAALVTLAVLAMIIGLIMVRGLPSLSWGSLTGTPENLGRDGGILPTIVGTVVLGAVSLPIATPLGVGSAIYLTEYTHETIFTRAIRFGTESLAGVPSIIFGLFGFIFFVTYLQMGWSILAGGLTLALMMLPTIIRTTEEAIRTVPQLPQRQLQPWRHPLADGHDGGFAERPARHPHRCHSRIWPRSQRNRGGDLYRRRGAEPAHFRILAGAHHGSAFLHPRGRRYLA